MPDTNRGDKYSARWRGRDVPHLDRTPTVTPARTREVVFVPTALTGGQKVSAGGVWYGIPSTAQAKHRGSLVWVLNLGKVHVLSKHGEVLLSDADQKRFAASWSRI